MKPEERVGSFRAGVIDSCKPSYLGPGNRTGAPLQEQQGSFTAETSPQSQFASSSDFVVLFHLFPCTLNK